jgi:2-methylcitrate dehydratase PrpD
MIPAAALPEFLVAWDACARRADALLSTAAAEAARRSWFDTLATTTAGVAENCTRAALQACGSEAAQDLSPTDTALVLGTASHALDYDDVCMLATCHPSAPPVATLFALLPQLERQQPGLPLQDLLAAYLVGVETMLRLGQWLGFRHYALGFHATGTLGAVGSAAAAAHALRLPAAQAHAALSIAASSACGLRANFGTDTKPLHVGFAAAAGLRAALLARAGADASDDVWGPTGFGLAFNGGEALGPLPWRADGEWAIVEPGFEHKRYPSCYLTHRLIAGILKIRERQSRTTWSQPVEIEVEVAHNGLAALKHPEATTGLQGKFSGHYCAAAAWVDGRVGLPAFSDSAVQRAPLQAQMQRVVLRERSTAGESLDTAPVHVTVRGEGWTDRITVDWAPGSAADPMTREQLELKWRDCARHGGLDATPPAALLDAPLDAPAAALLLPLRRALLAAIPH